MDIYVGGLYLPQKALMLLQSSMLTTSGYQLHMISRLGDQRQNEGYCHNGRF